MKSIFFTLFFTLSLVIPVVTEAETEKKINIGFASYRLNSAYNNLLISSNQYKGAAISASYAPSNHLAFNAGYYSMKHDTFTASENTGFELMAYWGGGFIRRGFKAYYAAGFFSETLILADIRKRISNIQVGVGAGYNWRMISLDFTLNIRDTTDYEELFQDSELSGSLEPLIFVSSLRLSGRF